MIFKISKPIKKSKMSNGPVTVTEEWLKNTYDKEGTDNYYESQYLLPYPEFAVKKLRIEDERILNLLDNLPPIEERTREQVLKWMKDSELTRSDFDYVGW